MSVSPLQVSVAALHAILQQLPSCSTPQALQTLQTLGAELGPLEFAVAPRLHALVNAGVGPWIEGSVGLV